MEKPDALLQAQEAMQKRLPFSETVNNRGILRAIDPLQGTFDHDPRKSKHSSRDTMAAPLSLLEWSVSYKSYVDNFYDWALKPTNKIAGCVRSPVLAIKTWIIPKEIVWI